MAFTNFSFDVLEIIQCVFIKRETMTEITCKSYATYSILFQGNTDIKSLEFVDDIADLNDDMISAQVSCKVMKNMQDQKRLTFSAEKCEY